LALASSHLNETHIPSRKQLSFCEGMEERA
jgi:hypothetical protein